MQESIKNALSNRGSPRLQHHLQGEATPPARGGNSHLFLIVNVQRMFNFKFQEMKNHLKSYGIMIVALFQGGGRLPFFLKQLYDAGWWSDAIRWRKNMGKMRPTRNSRKLKCEHFQDPERLKPWQWQSRTKCWVFYSVSFRKKPNLLSPKNATKTYIMWGVAGDVSVFSWYKQSYYHKDFWLGVLAVGCLAHSHQALGFWQIIKKTNLYKNKILQCIKLVMPHWII